MSSKRITDIVRARMISWRSDYGSYILEHPTAEMWVTGCRPEIVDYATEFSTSTVCCVRVYLSPVIVAATSHYANKGRCSGRTPSGCTYSV